MRDCLQRECICLKTWGKMMSWCRLRLKRSFKDTTCPRTGRPCTRGCFNV
jgi:hypothetical protein